LNILSSHSFHK